MKTNLTSWAQMVLISSPGFHINFKWDELSPHSIDSNLLIIKLVLSPSHLHSPKCAGSSKYPNPGKWAGILAFSTTPQSSHLALHSTSSLNTQHFLINASTSSMMMISKQVINCLIMRKTIKSNNIMMKTIKTTRMMEMRTTWNLETVTITHRPLKMWRKAL